ncbi:MAG: Holliday junction resolvase RuvX [Ostreibacterium sp.]
MATLIGIDYGSKKIGFAVGQTITGTATPLSVVYQNGKMWHLIDDIFFQWKPKLVIVGKPELADGALHPLEKKIESFIFQLKTRYNIQTYRINEAYTSFEAGFYQQDKGVLDAYAATIILESWLRLN